ncbi:MAG TPA: HAD-IA family hydrolase [Thermomicrobiales bacterium]|nr:HAD-IA family hydrolase [Thermomicrobiales bacterium]
MSHYKERERMGEHDKPIDGAIFDLDGTLTHTVDLHEVAWQEAFDGLFSLRLQRSGEWQRPFDTADYRAFVDGRPRADGIKALLDSRGIDLPDGTDDDPAGSESIVGLGKRQRQLFLEGLDRIGAAPDADALRLLGGLREMGAGIALASADEDAERILEHVGLGVDLFDVALFESLGSTRNLRPKPAPDVFVACLERLGIEDGHRVVVFDDSVVGVAAARAAGIGLTVGIDRGGNASALRAHGADWVVQSLREVSVLQIAAHLARSSASRP